ncbi:MAG: N-acetylmuramoyl-L-alanine amidase [Selenomonas sp.]|nr:N-acetylmuramoyl-L-alanine amidase [Selenomonadales bacterium]MDD7762674.1 N-acetylmuramoyl-L-alanine amidase [Selenomonadales bacterium]MDY5717435.1 N-acetylmuramoyl-L-alanine amidase [Selenomonas sp.]
MRQSVLRIIVFIMLFVVLPTASAGAAGSDFGSRVDGMAEITAIRTSSNKDKTRIVIDANKTVTYKKMVLSSPDRVVVDIANAWLSDKVKKNIALNNRFVAGVRIAQFDKKTVRMVVETKVGKNNYKVFALKGGSAPERVVLDFGNIGPNSANASIKLPDSKPAGKPATKPASKPIAKPNTSEAHKPINKPAEEASKPQPAETTNNTANTDSSDTDAEIAAITGLKGRKITIDAGHGGNDSGAIGPTGVMEKTVTLRIANEVRRLLMAEGATVYMTRDTDTEVSPKGANASDIEELQARCDVANQNASDVFVSIHMDSFSSGAAKGTTGYYYSLGSQKSRDLADKVRSGVIDQIGTQSRGTQSCNFYVVKHTDMPATLVEVAFISNPTEEQLLDSEDGIKKAAQGIVDGIADFFG